jgi:hypothetical protein
MFLSKMMCKFPYSTKQKYNSPTNKVIILLTLLTHHITPTVAQNHMWLQNWCPFPIYVWTDANPLAACNAIDINTPCTSDILEIPPPRNGVPGSYQVPFWPLDNADLLDPDGKGGLTLKMTLTPDKGGDVYQAEMSVSGGVVWYNFSHENGDPLIGGEIPFLSLSSSSPHAIV